MAKYGKLVPERCVLFVCDMQERFAPSIVHFPTIVKQTARLVETANVLDIPVIVTEQYPKVFTLMVSNNVRRYLFTYTTGLGANGWGNQEQTKEPG